MSEDNVINPIEENTNTDSTAIDESLNTPNTETDSEKSIEEKDTADNSNQSNDSEFEFAAIPYINGAKGEVHPFSEAAIVNTADSNCLTIAENYFFSCYINDEKPKWDGIFYCKFNKTTKQVEKSNENRFIDASRFLSRYLWNEPGAKDNVTFTVKCTMPRVWASHFESFLKRLEQNGNNGYSSQISIFADGNGIFKPKFSFSKQFTNVNGIPSNSINEKAEEMYYAG